MSALLWNWRKTAPRAGATARGARGARLGSGVAAETAAKCVALVHQPGAGNDLHSVVIVFLVLHILGCLALDDNHGPHELVILFAEIDLADGRLNLPAGFV